MGMDIEKTCSAVLLAFSPVYVGGAFAAWKTASVNGRATALRFAREGARVLAVDRDEVSAAVASVNLRHWPEARVRQADPNLDRGGAPTPPRREGA